MRQTTLSFCVVTLSCVVVSVVLTTSTLGADWGDLTAKFVFDGTPPAPTALAGTNKDGCEKHNLVDESLVVNPQSKGVANVVVFLYTAKGEKAPPVHDSYKESEKGNVPLDNEKCRFEPRIVGLRTTQTLLVGNKDTFGHNTNVATFTNQPQNITIPAGTQLKYNFPQPETSMAVITCGIHPWMKGYAVIKDHPYIAVSDKDGLVTIKNLPAGNWTFQLWHERPGYLTAGTQNGKAVKWERGRVKMDIKAGANDMGEIKLSSSTLAQK